MVFKADNHKDLPQKINIETRTYTIVTDFRDWITFELLLNDPQIDAITKQLTILDMMVIDRILPEDIESVINALFSFYFLHKERRKVKEKNTEVAYSYVYDWNYIYAAFMQQYQMDLFEVKMHWFKFKSLFDSLNDTTQFIKIVGYRTMNIASIKDKTMREKYMHLKEQYALPLVKKQADRTAKEIETEILTSMKGGEIDDK